MAARGSIGSHGSVAGMTGDDGLDPVPTLPAPSDDRPTERLVDPRAVRVALGPTSSHADLAPMIVEPPAVPLAPSPRVAGTGVLGGIALSPDLRTTDPGNLGLAVVDGATRTFQLTRIGPVHATLTEGGGGDPAARTAILILPPGPAGGRSGHRRSVGGGASRGHRGRLARRDRGRVGASGLAA